MANLSACALAPNGDVITPKGRMSYARNAVVGQKNDNGDIRYQLSMYYPPGSDMTVLKNEMFKVAMEKLGDEAKAKKAVKDRFLDAVEKGADPEEFDGWILLRMSSASRPGFVFGNGKRVPDDDLEEEVYSGRWGRTSVNPYWFDNKKNKGVTNGLQNVQLLDHDDPIGGAKPRAEDQFETVPDDDGGKAATVDSMWDDD